MTNIFFILAFMILINWNISLYSVLQSENDSKTRLMLICLILAISASVGSIAVLV